MGHWEAIGKSNEWYTPKYIFDALGETFDLDVAAPVDRTFCHVPAREFITERSLELVWGDGFKWMNPPFGGRNGLRPWIEKINRVGNAIVLTPDRTSAEWWQDASRMATGHLQVAGRIKFIRPDGSIGEQPGNGTTLFAYGERAVEALYRAERNNLGLVFRR